MRRSIMTPEVSGGTKRSSRTSARTQPRQIASVRARVFAVRRRLVCVIVQQVVWQWPAASFSLGSAEPDPERPRIQVEKADEADKARDAEIRKALARGEKPAGELSQTAGEKVARLYRTDDVDAPMTFRLQFEPDLVLVVRGEPRGTDLGSRVRRAKYALQDGWQGFRLWLDDEPIATRVVVHLPPEDARRLFKVLVPRIRLLVQQ